MKGYEGWYTVDVDVGERNNGSYLQLRDEGMETLVSVKCGAC